MLSNNTKAIIGLTLFVFLGISILIPSAYASSGCYDRFIFNWFSANDFFICIDNAISSGGAVNSLHAGNGISVNATTGNILVSNTGVLKDVAGTGITVNQTTGNVLITNSLPENTVCSNSTSSSGHLGICKDNTITLRTIKSGSGISASLNSTDITISNSGVTSLTANSPISANASTGSITISCSTCATTSDNNVLLDNSFPVGGSTSWTSGTFTAKKYITLIIFMKGNATTITNSNIAMRFNGDTGANYDFNFDDRGTITTSTAQTSMRFMDADENNSYYITGTILNTSTNPKFLLSSSIANANTASAGRQFTNSYDVWLNTSNQITSITILTTSGGFTFSNASYMLIYGHD